MPPENVQEKTSELGWWIVLGLLLAACLTAYFVYSPGVEPVIRPSPSVTELP